MCTRDHGATRFSLQIGPTEPPRMRREASGVSFLMCPFCVRALLSTEATRQRFRPRRTQLRRGDAQQRTYGVDATEHDDELLPVRRAVRSAARRVGRGWQRVLHMVICPWRVRRSRRGLRARRRRGGGGEVALRGLRGRGSLGLT